MKKEDYIIGFGAPLFGVILFGIIMAMTNMLDPFPSPRCDQQQITKDKR